MFGSCRNERFIVRIVHEADRGIPRQAERRGICEDRLYIETSLRGISISTDVSCCHLVELGAIFHAYYLSKWITCCYKQGTAFPRAQINEKKVSKVESGEHLDQ